MRYVLTGGTGYVGGRLLRSLLADGHEVHCLGRSRLPLEEYLALPGRVVQHTFDGTLASVEACVQAAAAEAVIHLAARRSVSDAPEELEELLLANTLFPGWLVHAAARSGTGCFLNTGSWWQWDENGRYRPVCLYSATKHAFEDLLEFYAERYALRATTLVLYDVYGPADPRATVLKQVVRAAREGRRLPMTEGMQHVAFLHVDDAVAAYRVLLARCSADPEPGHERFFAVVPAVPLRDAVQRLEQVLETRVADFGARPADHRVRMRPYFGPPVPDWTPRVTLDEGLRGLV